MAEYTILVVDDDKEIAGAIEIYLRNEGYSIIKAYDGLAAIDAMHKNDIDLVIMDVMMPGLDGLQTTRMIREEFNTPILMLSAKSEDYDKIIGLNMGSDDYMTKPFNPLELIARVKSQLRRYNNFGGSHKQESKVFRTGGLEVDDDAKSVTVDGRAITLTPTEYKIVKFLTENAGRVYQIDQIYEAVWGEEAFNADNTVAVHVRRIREKIEIDPKNPRYLKVIWGVGYKMEKY